MTLLDLIAELNRLNIQIISVNDDRLIYCRFPKGALNSQALRVCMKRHSGALRDMVEQKNITYTSTEKATK